MYSLLRVYFSAEQHEQHYSSKSRSTVHFIWIWSLCIPLSQKYTCVFLCITSLQLEEPQKIKYMTMNKWHKQQTSGWMQKEVYMMNCTVLQRWITQFYTPCSTRTQLCVTMQHSGCFYPSQRALDTIKTSVSLTILNNQYTQPLCPSITGQLSPKGHRPHWRYTLLSNQANPDVSPGEPVSIFAKPNMYLQVTVFDLHQPFFFFF